MTVCIVSPAYAHMVKPGQKPPASLRKTAVYRLIGHGGDILYVGMSANPPVRLKSHFAGERGGEVATASVEWFPDKAAAREAEREAIQSLRPAWNKRCNPDHVHEKLRDPRSVGGLKSLRRAWEAASPNGKRAFLAEIGLLDGGAA